ncbi:hypothetical protein SAMN04489735_104516 [Aneurinibacillus thermoaerophilus]|uniref:Uncharacterized protein n=1 Tax=Aneurinibacillus thermoaerophilus TaxID=143495 RepID=A0A1G8EKN9_ANETH|nr:hypothetical protein [Aneurinibacillus thermoaerophilus]SDH70411.1 hypothetical protein SAMN04489735_104516 [Aneurinibacillus thermoaerophilus]
MKLVEFVREKQGRIELVRRLKMSEEQLAQILLSKGTKRKVMKMYGKDKVQVIIYE